jgi:hypothetical protein
MSGDRRLVLVVGVGRSGTSLLTGVLGQLGFHIPQPEVQADDTNPRGFGEPRWVVDFHTRLLRERGVTVNDSRPGAWDATADVDDAAVRTARDWLDDQLRQGEAVVVKDPRTVWFLPLWLRCARELGVAPSFVTMLRHPAEILTSARKSYGDWQSEASRAAAWLNVALETEHATRGDRRAFVRYEDLLTGWQAQVGRVGERLDLPLLTGGLDAGRIAAVDAFVDPGLHRNRVTWDDVDVPPSVRDLGERVWQQLQPLADPDGDTPEAHAALDAARDEFRALYAQAEAVAQSSITAAKRAGKQAARRNARAAAPPSLRVRVARRIPKRHRRRVKQAIAALRRS